MPILPAEQNCFPESLLAAATPPEMAGRIWWVLHTRPRQEKSLARQLLASAVPFYLPLVSRRLRVRGRPLTSHMPLFTSYLFLLAARDDRLVALATSRVVRCLPVANQEGLWRDLRQVHLLLRSGVPVTPEERLAPGMLVEIRNGPLAGLKGTILQAASQRRFVVAVDFIQRGASVLLDDCSLVPVEAEGHDRARAGARDGNR